MATPRKRGPSDGGGDSSWWYSDPQLDEIRRALTFARNQEASDADFQGLLLRLRLVIGSREVSLADAVGAASHDIVQLERDITTLEAACQALARFEAPQSDQETLRHHIQNARAKLARSEAFIVDASEYLPKRSNNYRRFRARICSVIDSAWIASGGSIEYSIAYQRFFNAIVRPPFSDPDIMSSHGVSWTAGGWRSHVGEVKAGKDLQFRGEE